MRQSRDVPSWAAGSGSHRQAWVLLHFRLTQAPGPDEGRVCRPCPQASGQGLVVVPVLGAAQSSIRGSSRALSLRSEP